VVNHAEDTQFKRGFVRSLNVLRVVLGAVW
jgi:hypothetical protein